MFRILISIAAALIVGNAWADDRVQPALDCALTPADLNRNATLTFEQFDQLGTTPATARALGQRRCYAAAAKASEHYLLFGPELTEGERNVVAWHLGQYVASAGDEAAAAWVIATARRPSTPEADGFDWNTYVVGTWAFLVKDRGLLEASHKKLTAAPGERNGINARALTNLMQCFDRPYAEASHGCKK